MTADLQPMIGMFLLIVLAVLLWYGWGERS